MILVDANLLIYAHVRSTVAHPPARAWLEEQFNAGHRVGLPWPSLLAFLRIVTNPRVFETPQSFDQAWARVLEWLALDCTWIPQATDRHVEIVTRLVPHARAQSKLIPDAHLAALAIEHGLTLCSADHDFARFPELRWRDPLQAE